MQLTDIFYVTLLVVVTATFAQEYEENRELRKTKKHNIRKRETIVLYDNFPVDPIYKSKPSVVYRRISHQRHNTKPNYGPPRTKYRYVKPSRRPLKKYKKTPPKYGPPTRKKRPYKLRYGPPKYSQKPYFGATIKYHHMFSSSEPVGFGEPPNDFYQQYSNLKQSFAEPPSEFPSLSKATYNVYQLQDFSPMSLDTQQAFDLDNKHWNPFQNNLNLDTSLDFTNKQPTFQTRETQFDVPDDDMNAYVEYKNRDRPLTAEEEHNVYETRRQPYFIDDIISTKPKRIMKPKTEAEEVVVGGQYAEPPARIVHKSYSEDHPYEDDISADIGYVDPDVAASATISPYVNYKNSNLAFSPQNLNDAFSIIDKK
ncbi:uncharacterized protein LOC123720881 [Pieris brassicae]|uniref:uncharacterized protein LOC123720881 n=1 Tax=Pieris brassicae TaxID=7116 RepID=UPI001E660069|nr:uncharacterized protein LOC123720881 [Pieris brassicae]